MTYIPPPWQPTNVNATYPDFWDNLTRHPNWGTFPATEFGATGLNSAWGDTADMGDTNVGSNVVDDDGGSHDFVSPAAPGAIGGMGQNNASGTWGSPHDVMLSGRIVAAGASIIAFMGVSSGNSSTTLASNNPTLFMHGLQYSSARGDASWQIVYRNPPGAQVLRPTGIPPVTARVLFVRVQTYPVFPDPNIGAFVGSGPFVSRVTVYDETFAQLFVDTRQDAMPLVGNWRPNMGASNATGGVITFRKHGVSMRAMGGIP